VVKLEASEDSTFDYWLVISTLQFRKQLFVPVKLADYHREVLKDKTIIGMNVNGRFFLQDSGLHNQCIAKIVALCSFMPYYIVLSVYRTEL
jgi:hypothetical protein